MKVTIAATAFALAGTMAVLNEVESSKRYALAISEFPKLSAEKGPDFAKRYAEGIVDMYDGVIASVQYRGDVAAAKEYLKIIGHGN